MSERTCIEPGCDGIHRSQGFCNKHYKRRMKAALIEPHALPPIHERLADRITYDGDCWLWTGSLTGNGYGRAEYNGDAWLVHRLVYMLTNGPIPDGLVLDHLCRTITCCNPDHLEPVVQRENIHRGIGPSAINALKTHCKNGHEFTEDNIAYDRGKRRCRTCNNAKRRKAA